MISSYKFNHCLKQKISLDILYNESILDKIIFVIISQYLLFILIVFTFWEFLMFCKSSNIFLKFSWFWIFSNSCVYIVNKYFIFSSMISLYDMYISFISSFMNSKLLKGFI